MKLVLLDLETLFDSKAGYTLRKMSTESYVRDPRFKVHLSSYWVPAEMPQGPVTFDPMLFETNDELRRTIETSAVMAFHAHFDLLALQHWYGLKPAFIFDPLPMARLVLPRLKSHSLDALAAHFGLGSKTVPYNEFDGLTVLPPDLYRRLAEGCVQDTRLMWSIFKLLLPAVPKDELLVISSTIQMFISPVLRLDRPRMSAFLKAEKIRKAKAMLVAGEAIGLPPFSPYNYSVDLLKTRLEAVETELQSAAKFKIALEALGYPCPMKWSDKAAAVCPACNGATITTHDDGSVVRVVSCGQCNDTGKTKGGYIPALAKSDEGMKALAEHDDPRVQALAAARLGVKSTINETRAETLLAADARGALPVYLSYAATKTLRPAGGDKNNWLNFPRGGEIRKSILAPDGHSLVIGDKSQIEYRLLCYVTGQTDKLDALVAGRDLYVEFASELFGRSVTKENKPERQCGKVGVLQSGYGAGSGSIQRAARNGSPSVILTDEEALRARDLYRSTHGCVTQFWKVCGDVFLPTLANGGTVDYKGIIRIANHKIHLPNGTALDYTGLRWARNCDVYQDQQDDGEGYAWWEPSRKGYTRTWGSHLTADIIQSLAWAMLKDVMVRMLARHCRPLLSPYDELVYAVPTADAERVAHGLETEMTTPPAWAQGLPLACEIIIDDCYNK